MVGGSTIERRLAEPPVPGYFGPEELEGLDEPVRRHLTAAIAPGAPLACAVHLQMRGRIKVGRWLPFRARQVENPHRGLVWRARAAGVISGADRYADGRGAMEWKLLGLVPLVRADGPDVSRSTAGRVGAEGMWAPTALLPRFGTRWSAVDEDTVTVRHRVDDTSVEVRYRLDGEGRIASFTFERWGDPDRTGTWSRHPFGGEVTAYRSFDAVAVPAAGRVGWHHGTDRSANGEFFRFELTDLRLTRSGDR